MLIDDHPIVRTALANLVDEQPDLTVCAEAGDAAETITQLERTKPDLLVMDFTMPGRSGLELIKDVKAIAPEARILVLSMHDENHYAERVLRAGASGFIMKSVGSEAILAAIRQVLQTGVFLSSSVSTRILRNLMRPAQNHDTPQVGQLSDREFEIFILSGQGLDAPEIAAQLRISRKTVDVHRANIKRKLNLNNTTSLIRYAVQWVESERPEHS